MVTKCPVCGHIEAVKDEYLGQVAECPKCHKEFTIERTASQQPSNHPGHAGGAAPIKAAASRQTGTYTTSDASIHWELASAAFAMALCARIWGSSIQIPILATLGVPLTVIAIFKCCKRRSTFAVALSVVALIIFAWTGFSARRDIDNAAGAMERSAMSYPY